MTTARAREKAFEESPRRVLDDELDLASENASGLFDSVHAMAQRQEAFVKHDQSDGQRLFEPA